MNSKKEPRLRQKPSRTVWKKAAALEMSMGVATAPLAEAIRGVRNTAWCAPGDPLAFRVNTTNVASRKQVFDSPDDWLQAANVSEDNIILEGADSFKRFIIRVNYSGPGLGLTKFTNLVTMLKRHKKVWRTFTCAGRGSLH